MKIHFSKERIIQWYNHYEGNVYVAFSGGKDSTVLLNLVRDIYPKVPAVFVDTGLEYPEIKNFVKTIENVEILRPKIPFNKIIEKYGYPLISKEIAYKIHQYRQSKSDYWKKCLRGDSLTVKNTDASIPKRWLFLLDAPFKISSFCCDHLKKKPFLFYEKNTNRKPYIGIMAKDSDLRERTILKNGCNAFDLKHPQSRPISFWKDEDVWQYIKTFNIPYCDIYDKGEVHTGCIFCGFGCHIRGYERYDKIKELYPKLYDYCMNILGFEKVIKYIIENDVKNKKKCNFLF